MTDRREPPFPEDENWGPQTPWQTPGPPAADTSPSPSAPPGPPTAPPQQSWGPDGRSRARPAESHMAGAVISLFLFLPTGLAAIIFASEVNAKNTSGDYAGAAESSRKARRMVIWSLALFAAFWVIVMMAAAFSGVETETVS
ncbi:CD225/dispanin family protein [Streptomyces bambusae]|uniref:CD225/dispanin family protein n=1 Tax=Streptomyces bambusae TaxID=1550616 RepID=A0ABS6Z693_9ACTN|nr:CD225/dispanin family protein [Streptomyces bambusae]MBW5483285.1 hypothetical protein [Streptomyces bambusae]